MGMETTLIRVVVILLFIVFATVCHADDLEKGITTYEQGDYPEALFIFQSLAEKGVAEACYYVRQMYYFGEGVQENVSEAIAWFRRGADLEDPKSDCYHFWGTSTV